MTIDKPKSCFCGRGFDIVRSNAVLTDIEKQEKTYKKPMILGENYRFLSLRKSVRFEIFPGE